MAIYIIVLIFEIIFGLLLSVNKRENSKKFFIIITFVILTIVAGIRTKDVGTDTEQYYRAYKRIGTYTSINSAFNERYEKGFVILCYGLNKISSDPQILIFITSAFINFCVLRFIYRNSNNLVYSVYLYITLNFYFSYMNIMRQAVAIGFLLLAFENLKSKKYVKYFLEILLAMSFHGSAILGILYLFASRFKYKKKYNKFLLPLFIIVFIMGRKILVLIAKFSPRILEYMGGMYDVSNYFGSLVMAMIPIIMLYFGNDVLKNKEISGMDIFRKIIIINIIFAVLSIRVGIFYRFIAYFSIFQIIWIPNMLKAMKKNRNEFKIVFATGFFMYWLLLMIYRPEWYGVVPYKIMNL